MIVAGFLCFRSCKRQVVPRLACAQPVFAVLTEQPDSSATAVANAASRLSAVAEHTIQDLIASTSGPAEQANSCIPISAEQLGPLHGTVAQAVQATQGPSSVRLTTRFVQMTAWVC